LPAQPLESVDSRLLARIVTGQTADSRELLRQADNRGVVGLAIRRLARQEKAALARLGVSDEREGLGEAGLHRQRMLDPAIGLAQLRQPAVGGRSGDAEENGREREADDAETSCDRLSQ
jgi:hypothetical protein